MLDDLDNRINRALIFLSNSKDCTATAYEIENDRDSFSYTNIVVFLIKLGLAVKVNPFNLQPDTCRISKKGIDILKNGGWLKHLEREKIKSDKENRKLEYDLKISKLKANTFFIVLFLGAFGGIYSIIKVFIFIIGLSNPTETKVINSQNELDKLEKVITGESQIYSEYDNQDSLQTYSSSNSDKLIKK